MSTTERKHWKTLAGEYGFNFHTMYGQPYWDESAYYQFSLAQIEQDIEAPTEELHQMCLHVVNQAVDDEETLTKLAIPEAYWQAIADSYKAKDPSLYSRLDLIYDGRNPAKLLENNADTPTSLYETGFWQWLWLEQKVDSGELSRGADQFNSLQEKLVAQFASIEYTHLMPSLMHFACCKDSDEDRGTVQYLQDCATEAGINHNFVYIEDIGLSDNGELTDLNDQVISDCFKLYPWEFMQREEFGPYAVSSNVRWLEPIWKSVLSNKGLLALLWQAFENHPNLLPAYFADDFERSATLYTGADKWVKKPLFSREGANISILKGKSVVTEQSEGPYGAEGFVYQAYQSMPRFAQNHTIIGAWLVGDKAAGMSLREDKSPITQDLSRFVPHIIL